MRKFFFFISLVFSFLILIVFAYTYSDRIQAKLESAYLQFQISQSQQSKILNTFNTFEINRSQIISHNFDNLNFEKDFFITNAWGDKGFEPDQFIQPYGTMLYDNFLFISDCRKGKIMIFDTETNELVSSIGYGWGQEDGFLDYPADISLNKLNISNNYFEFDKIFVADYNNHRIQIFDKNGKFIGKFGNSTLLSGPKTVSVSDKGEIFVTDLFATFKYVTKWEASQDKAINPYNFYLNSSDYYFPKNINEIPGYPFTQNTNYQILEYTPEYPFFSNYTIKKRMVFVPNGEIVDLDKNIFPDKTVIQKDFYQNTDYELIERRFMIYDNNKWNYASYKNETGFLELNLSPSVKSVNDTIYGKFDYYVPGLNNCYDCHKNNSNETLGFLKENLVYDKSYSKNPIIKLTGNSSIMNEDKLIGNFKANCAYCHNDVTVFALDGSDLESKIYKMSPVSMDTLIVPGNPKKSKIYTVIENMHMPPYGITFEDQVLLKLLKNYINNLTQIEQ